MSTPLHVLEYLKVILSPQVLGAGAFIGALLLFRVELRALIGRIAAIRWGDAEISTPQLPTEASNNKQEKLPAPEQPPLPVGLSVSPEDAKRLEQAMLAERARAHLWEYRYLNHFLVIGTQRVLDWLAALSNATTFTAFDAMWQPFISTAEQRRTIIRVLEEHNLVAIHGDLIEVTPKGREYIQWRGPLPTLPHAPTSIGRS